MTLSMKRDGANWPDYRKLKKLRLISVTEPVCLQYSLQSELPKAIQAGMMLWPGNGALNNNYKFPADCIQA